MGLWIGIGGVMDRWGIGEGTGGAMQSISKQRHEFSFHNNVRRCDSPCDWTVT